MLEITSRLVYKHLVRMDRSSKPGPSLRQLAAAVLLLGSLSIATHGRVIDNGYVLDAISTVQLNSLVRADASLVEIFSAPYWDPALFRDRGLYRPIAVASFHWTRMVWDEPVIAIDHAIDLALHVLCGFLFFAFLMQMEARFGIALSLATIFILHPVQTETVSSLVGRCDLLATFFALAALNLALARRVPTLTLWPGLFGLFALSLFAKESTAGLIVILPACWAARELWRGTAPVEIRRHTVGLIVCIGLAISCYVVLRQRAIGGLVIGELPSFEDGRSGFFELRWRALAFISLYPQKLIWPLPLLPDYVTGVLPTRGLEYHLRAAFSAIAMLGSVAWPLWSWLRHRKIGREHLGLLLFWVALAPVSNLILQIGAPFGERFFYFPLLFLLLAASGLPFWRPTKVWDLGAIPKLWPVWGVVVIALGMISAERVPAWRENRSLFSAAAADSPDNYKAQVDYATLLFRQGQKREDRTNARKAFSAAARIRPDAYTPRTALGVLSTLDRNHREALAHFEDAWSRSDELDSHGLETAAINLSHTYRTLEQFEEMENFILPLAREHPEWSRVQAELTDYWWTHERFQEALEVLETRLQREPESKVIWRKIIEAHLRLGQNERAAKRLADSPAGTANYLFELQLEKDGLEMPGVRP
jgi:hypothetical protein